MTVPTPIEFLTRFPEFGEQASSVIDQTLTEAGRSVSADVMGSRYPEAVSYLAAHMLAMRTMQIGAQLGMQSGGGSSGGTRITGAASIAFGSRLDDSHYGQEYQRLLYSSAICGFAL